jgi:membrane-anchored mycosin MYCP
VLAIRRRRWSRGYLGSVIPAVVVLVLLSAGASAMAATVTGPGYVKYYVVDATYQGTPENLSEIAGRFLGSPIRSNEIFDLNAGTVQLDGGKLTDPAELHAGWALVLPWDAVGTDVQYGLLPTALPPSTTAPSKTVPPTKKPTPPAQAPTVPTPTTAGQGATGKSCAATTPMVGGDQTGWAMLRLAPDHAWTYSRGAGVMVAVVDSGVDASLPELAGHVTVGADIVKGTGRGDTDCLGTGTAMAGIVAARSGSSGGGIGIAPDATVMPVRVASSSPAVSELDQASAIEVAVSAGAKVIALGAYIDPAQPAVGNAIASAAAHGVVVVVGAPAASANGATAAPLSPMLAVLRVGAIGIDGNSSMTYKHGAVDVVAPGIDVASLGISGVGRQQSSGTQYAVAFAAGQAALVRAMYPNLTAAQVVRRIEATADRMGTSAPDAAFGWGLINPGEAVTRDIGDEGRTPSPEPLAAGGTWSSLRTRALIIAVLLAFLMMIVLVLRVRRMVRAVPLVNTEAAGDPDSGGFGADRGSDWMAGEQTEPGPTRPRESASAAETSVLTAVRPAASSGVPLTRRGGRGAGVPQVVRTKGAGSSDSDGALTRPAD